MARQAGMRLNSEDRAGSALTIEDLVKRCALPPAAKRTVRDALRRLEGEAKDARAKRSAALATVTEADQRRAGAQAELDRLRDILAATRTSLDDARASEVALQAANAELQRALDAATALPPSPPPAVPEAQVPDASPPAPPPALTPPPDPLPLSSFAPAAPSRSRAAPRSAAAELTPEPPRPTPAVPSAEQAACHRGRVDTHTAIGALLVRAPKVPGGYAGQCFATLLERAAADLPRMATDEDEDGASRRHGPREDLMALASLYRNEGAFYRDLALYRGDGLPLNGDRMRVALAPQRGSSPAHACVEMADG